MKEFTSNHLILESFIASPVKYPRNISQYAKFKAACLLLFLINSD